MGSGTSIGIGGMSVRECVKLRERERTKERDAQRAAALEAKAARDAAKSQTGADGWAQVASRGKKSGADSSTASTRSTTPVQSLFQSRSIYSALAGGKMPDTSSPSSKKELLVLRSGVGAGKALRTQSSAEVVDSWEEAEEKEEQAEQAEQEQAEQEQAEQEQGKTSLELEAQPEIAETADEAVPPAEVEVIKTPSSDVAEGDSAHA